MRIYFLIMLMGTAWQFGCFAPAGKEPNPGPAPVPAQVLRLSSRILPVFHELVGTVRSAVVVEISSKVTGQVVSVRFKEGQRARRGERLVEIDHRETTAARRKALGVIAELQSALEELKRQRLAVEAQQKATLADHSLARVN
ncbi:MAG: biotin/lipoyl-binding protein [Acidobacteria bacterium]|nr:biotin/lipoyl-binding protein [Acidobacteriota bacterium]